jgi:hypothetical protein
MHAFLLEVDVCQYLTGGITLVDQHVEHRGKFGRFVDALAHSDDRAVLRVVEARRGPNNVLGCLAQEPYRAIRGRRGGDLLLRGHKGDEHPDRR